MDVRKCMRALEEAKAKLVALRRQLELLDLDNQRLSNDQARAVQEYRGRLQKYVRDIGSFAARSQNDPTMDKGPELKKYIELMLKDIVTTYSYREQELVRNLDRQRSERRELQQRCDEVAAAYQGCRLQLKNANVRLPSHLDLDLAGMVALTNDGDGSSGGSSTMKSLLLTRGATAPTMEQDLSPSRESGGGGGRAKVMDWHSLQAMVSEYTKSTQSKLEKERASLLVRCTMAEENAARFESYISTHMLSYQKEIIQLRHKIQMFKQAKASGRMGGF